MDKDCRREYGKMRCALLQLLLIVGGATGLKDLTINVPATVRSGDTVTLSCHYDLEGSSLYTIQWFHDNSEFYRYVFDRVPPASSFNVSGIQVNISKSNTHDVTLVDVSRNLTGWYKCEVSASSPSYHTMIEKAMMEVVDAPKTDPTIRTEKERIAVGETLRVNCTSGNSRPASTVTWKLNGDSIEDNNPHFIVSYHKTSHPDDMKSTKSQIEFRVTKDMFRNGRLRLRCTATISDVYRKSADIEITEDVPRIASITFESPYDPRANGCAGQNWPWNGNRGAAIIMATVAATLFLMMTSLMMTVPPITNVLARSEPAGSR
ncbi:PREDICTED: cell adhesion molecule 1-like [Dinoponera quadriceps]|uniref:Cell adhesion molecule 1-like n=1 Tax=Dinoponera quadriceps TaxID=609295 RepID=A0A6P3XRI4_DINQU|nr:PREDICTED: cell adhesion molecule 1-like [Dinoponera quadriceps]